MSDKQRDNLGYTSAYDEPPPQYNGKEKGGDYMVESGPVVEVEVDEEDPWKVSNLKQDYKPWDELNTKEKWIRGIMYPVKLILVLGFLYLFICSLDFLSSAFKLLGGKKAGEVFRNSDILTNPVAGLMMGVLVTVLVQSSSTSTSIIISMVAAGIVNPPKVAVPIIMGANIGTSVTNTIVAMGQITNKNDFRRAFAGATVHDMFNWMSVIVLLPLEVITGYLFKMSTALVESMHLNDPTLKNETRDVNQDLLKVITKPFTSLIISVSSSGITKIAQGEGVDTIMKFCCDDTKPDKCCSETLKDSTEYTTGAKFYNQTQKQDICEAVDNSCAKSISSPPQSIRMSNCTTVPWKTETTALNSLDCSQLGGTANEIACCSSEWETFKNTTRNATSQQQFNMCNSINSTCFLTSDVYGQCTSSLMNAKNIQQFDCTAWAKQVAEKSCYKECEFLFRDTHTYEGGPLTDEGIGGILLVISLTLLCVCLLAIVKVLHSLLQGPMANVIKKFVNANFPGKCGYFTGYLAILLGAGFTILVQSSSIFTSTLTPLVGIGVIELDRMYPLTLGSNIGTTFTGILAALSQTGDDIVPALEIAFCHLFFNISGILIFYPFPFFRPAIPAAKFLGNTTAKYRWFAIVYLICMFFAFPAIVFGLSIIDTWMLMILVPIAVVSVLVGIIKCIQAKRRKVLPKKLQDWKFLPEPMRSLRPFDNCMKKICFCKRFQTELPADDHVRNGIDGKGVVNNGFDNVASDKDYSTNL
ncbi:sodium-dependent phosphate transport protein 2B-like [Littorina saxatilis]|uniref:Uncharacterized protein n=1 Tax=Littorina saxatilis TaxID=31220 RepID=A0AAN9GCF0_9CAEN